MTTLKHDDQGFLTGTPIDLNNRTVLTVEAIRVDVKAIRQALLNPLLQKGGRRDYSNNPPLQKGGRGDFLTPRARDSKGRFVAAPKVAVPAHKTFSNPPFQKGGKGDFLTPRARDSKGRFVATPKVAVPAPKTLLNPRPIGNPPLQKGGRGDFQTIGSRGGVFTPRARDSKGPTSEPKTPKNKKQPKKKEAQGIASAVGNAVASRLNTLKEAAGSLNEADPSIKATQEALEPMKRGWNLIAGDRGEKEKIGWFRRILGELRLFRTSESSYNTIEKNLLKDIKDKDGEEGKKGGGIGGGIMGFLGGLFKPLIALTAPLLVFLEPLLAVLGVVLAGVGGFMLGKMISEKVGEWIKTLMEADIPGIISQKWGEFTAFASDSWGKITTTMDDWWDSFSKKLGSTWDTITGGFQSLLDSFFKLMKDKFGIDLPAIGKGIKNAASQTADAVKQNAGIANAWVKQKTGVDVAGSVGKGVDAVKEKAGAAWDATKGAASGAWDATKQGFANAKDWALGATSKSFESGKGGAGTVSTGKGDHGGASYGTYQLSSTQGTLQQYLKQSGYGDQFSGLKPGTSEFNAKWKDVAKNDPNFGQSQHDFIKATHYDPAVSGLQKSGIDLSGKGAAVQDALWSTSVQFGPGSSQSKSGAVPMVKNALAGKNAAEMSDSDIVSAIQDYKIAHNSSLFASSPTQQPALAKRAVSEKTKLLQLANAPPATPAITTGNAAPQPTPIPAAPPTPAPAEAPSIPTKLNNGSDKQIVAVTLPPSQTGQDVSDRGIAHIVTGGYSRA